MSQLERLTRTLINAARGWGDIESIGAPYISGDNTVSVEPGVVPYLCSFRLQIREPQLRAPRTFTVTIVEDAQR